MTYNANNRKDIRRAEKASAISDRQRVEFIVAAMSTVQGRAWYYDLLSACLMGFFKFIGVVFAGHF